MSSHNLKLDGVAQARATALLTPITAAVAAYNAAHPEAPPVVANAAYVLTGAVTTGLNFWRPPALWSPADVVGVPPDQPTIATFTPAAGTGVSTIAVTVNLLDELRCVAFIAALRSTPTTVNVLGCACCTGLAVLSGYLTVQGPFT